MSYKIIKATVAAIIVNEENPHEILLTRRAIEPYKNQWCLPGGHIDGFETAEHAIVREVKEETGLLFQPSFSNILMKSSPKETTTMWC